MIGYNLYIKGNKINNKPLSVDMLRKIIANGKFSKQVGDNVYKQYNIKDIKVIKSIIV